MTNYEKETILANSTLPESGVLLNTFIDIIGETISSVSTFLVICNAEVIINEQKLDELIAKLLELLNRLNVVANDLLNSMTEMD